MIKIARKYYKNPNLRRGFKGLATAILFIIAILQLKRLESFKDNPQNAIDFRNIYIGSVIISKGENPYKDSVIKSTWEEVRKEEALDKNIAPGLPTLGILYPPVLLHLCRPMLLIGYSNSVFAIKIFLFLNILFMALLLRIFLKEHKIYVSYGFLLLFLLALKPTVNMINVGQLSLFFINLFFIILLMRTQKKWQYLVSVMLVFLKPTIALSAFGNAIKRRKLYLLIFVLSGIFSVAFLFINGTEAFNGLLEQARGQVNAAYDHTASDYPYTFEAMSNTQFQSVAAILGLSERSFFYVQLLLAGLVLITGLLLFRQRKYAVLEFIAVLVSLVFTYHKYYDLLLLLPFLLCFLKKERGLLFYLSLITLIHLVFPYSFIKNLGFSESFSNKLQFLNSILPLILLLATVYLGLKRRETLAVDAQN